MHSRIHAGFQANTDRLVPFKISPRFGCIPERQRCPGRATPTTSIRSKSMYRPTPVTVTVDFDTLLENTISDHQILLAWNTAVLYPRGIDKRELLIEPSILLPPNWKQGSSMPGHQSGCGAGDVCRHVARTLDRFPGARRRVLPSRAAGIEMAGRTRLHGRQ